MGCAARASRTHHWFYVEESLDELPSRIGTSAQVGAPPNGTPLKESTGKAPHRAHLSLSSIQVLPSHYSSDTHRNEIPEATFGLVLYTVPFNSQFLPHGGTVSIL